MPLLQWDKPLRLPTTTWISTILLWGILHSVTIDVTRIDWSPPCWDEDCWVVR